MSLWDEPPAKGEEQVEVKKGNSKFSFKFGEGIKPAIDIPMKESTIISIFGGFGVGKSHWAFTAKRPIVIVDTERRADNILLQMSQHGDVNDIYQFDVMKYAQVTGGDLDYSNMLDKFRMDIVDFANQCKASEEKGTIVIDSMSDIIRWYGQWLDQQKNVKRDPDGIVSAFERGKSKEKVREFADLLKLTGWNIIFTLKEKQEWEGGKPADSYKPEWDKEMGHASDFVVNLRMVGSDRKFILHKNSFGNDTNLDIRNVDWSGFLEKITEFTGVKFRK